MPSLAYIWPLFFGMAACDIVSEAKMLLSLETLHINHNALLTSREEQQKMLKIVMNTHK